MLFYIWDRCAFAKAYTSQNYKKKSTDTILRPTCARERSRQSDERRRTYPRRHNRASGCFNDSRRMSFSESVGSVPHIYNPLWVAYTAKIWLTHNLKRPYRPFQRRGVVAAGAKFCAPTRSPSDFLSGPFCGRRKVSGGETRRSGSGGRGGCAVRDRSAPFPLLSSLSCRSIPALSACRILGSYRCPSIASLLSR